MATILIKFELTWAFVERLAIELYTGRFERLPSFCHLRRWLVRKFKSDQL